MKVHELKCWPTGFAAIEARLCKAEFRQNDRGFEAGDLILLREYVPTVAEYGGDRENWWADVEAGYTGNELVAQVAHVKEGAPIPEGYVVLSIQRVKVETT